MQQMDDKKLAKHPDIFREQMQTAYDQKNHKAYQLLSEYTRIFLKKRGELTHKPKPIRLRLFYCISLSIFLPSSLRPKSSAVRVGSLTSLFNTSIARAGLSSYL